jgi:hypothetical protein
MGGTQNGRVGLWKGVFPVGPPGVEQDGRSSCSSSAFHRHWQLLQLPSSTATNPFHPLRRTAQEGSNDGRGPSWENSKTCYTSSGVAVQGGCVPFIVLKDFHCAKKETESFPAGSHHDTMNSHDGRN